MEKQKEQIKKLLASYKETHEEFMLELFELNILQYISRYPLNLLLDHNIKICEDGHWFELFRRCDEILKQFNKEILNPLDLTFKINLHLAHRSTSCELIYHKTSHIVSKINCEIWESLINKFNFPTLIFLIDHVDFKCISNLSKLQHINIGESMFRTNYLNIKDVLWTVRCEHIE